MKLTWQIHQITDLAWGEAAALAGGVLTMSREALTTELSQDIRLEAVDFALAAPGQSCRIVPVFDVFEPRAKIEPAGHDWPGILTPLRPVGSGQTRVLRGMAVDVLDPQPNKDRIKVLDLHAAPVRGGHANDECRYSGLHHLVVLPRLRAGLDVNERSNALRLAGLRAATWLARGVDAPPDEQEIFDLSPAEGLPRVAYVYQLHSHQRPTVPGEGLLYGDPCRHLMPTLLHPNEVLDGAVQRAYDSNVMDTYGIQNHAVILDLYRRHGREIDFAGVVVNVANQLAEERDRATLLSGNLVRHTLQADGVVLTKSGGGAPHVDMALVAERCEQLGVRTAMLAWDLRSADDWREGAALFSSPLLNAIVSVGSNSYPFELPPVERVIAPSAGFAERYQGCTRVAALRSVGIMDHLGSGRYTTAVV
jgi:glycine reductase